MQIDPMLLNESPLPKWYAEAGDMALDADVSVSTIILLMDIALIVRKGIFRVQDNARYTLWRDHSLD
jgi:hypothetical protein